MKTSGVYLIKAENGLVKIGKTGNIENRFRTLQMGSPVNLEIVLFIDADEKELHIEYIDKIHHGEWYSLNEEEILRISKHYKKIDFSLEENKDKTIESSKSSRIMKYCLKCGRRSFSSKRGFVCKYCGASQ